MWQTYGFDVKTRNIYRILVSISTGKWLYRRLKIVLRWDHRVGSG
jgi:hypothetical protein